MHADAPAPSPGSPPASRTFVWPPVTGALTKLAIEKEEAHPVGKSGRAYLDDKARARRWM
jgi:hypothetical protein